MPKKKNDQKEKRKDDTAECLIELRGEAVVSYEAKPPRAPKGKRIHPRRPAPPVPDKEDR